MPNKTVPAVIFLSNEEIVSFSELALELLQEQLEKDDDFDQLIIYPYFLMDGKKLILAVIITSNSSDLDYAIQMNRAFEYNITWLENTRIDLSGVEDGDQELDDLGYALHQEISAIKFKMKKGSRTHMMVTVRFKNGVSAAGVYTTLPFEVSEIAKIIGQST